jgi:hypothetical protein
MAACSSSAQQVPNAIPGKVCSAKHGVSLVSLTAHHKQVPILREKYGQKARAEMWGKKTFRCPLGASHVVSQVHGSGGAFNLTSAPGLCEVA